MMMIAANKPRAQAGAVSSSVGSPSSTSSSSAKSASSSASSSSSSSVIAASNEALGKLAKSSNSSNETVIALEQTTAAISGPQIGASNLALKTADQQQETGKTVRDDDPRMSHNQDMRDAMTTTDQDITEDCNKQPPEPEPERKQPTGRLKAFLLLTRAHLSPFRQPRTQTQPQPQVGRKQSLDSSSAAPANLDSADNLAGPNLAAASKETSTAPTGVSGGRQSATHRYHKSVNLFNLAQRCFFFKQSSEFSLSHENPISRNHGRTCGADHLPAECASKGTRSAPVTPIKWSSLADGGAKPNDQPSGDSSAGGSSGAANRQPSAHKPSVRFVESCKDGAAQVRESPKDSLANGDDMGKWRAVHTQTAAAMVAKPQQQQQQPDDTDSSVANLFKLQDVVGEGEAPMNSSSFRQHGYSLIDYISNYLDTIKERRVTPLNIEPGYLKELLEPSAPELGESFANIMHDFEKHIMCGITHWQHPHFHAYFPAGNAYPSILADMLSDALGCVGFSWAASPAYTELEIIMLDWMGKMIGLPDEFLCLSSGASEASAGPSPGNAAAGNRQHESKGGGVIQGSASECVLVNLLAARHWAMEKLRKRYPQTPDGILLTKLIGYCSKEAHSCVEKAAMIGFIRMRALDTDEQHSLRGETLQKAIAMDKANGLEPFLVCATLGTTSCVSFDNLAELGPVCRDEDIWLHVDAAYAGSALICPEFQYLMKGIELVTSFNMNPNKWMLINFDCSLMWVRDRFKLTRAFVVDPLYLQHSFSDQAIDYRHWGIPLSRRFRALKLWFVIRNYGIAGLQAYIRNHVRLAKLFEQLIRQDSRFTINNQVVLGLVCFRLIGSNALNQRLLSMINASGRLHMVPASLEGRYVIRFCVCDQNAKEEDIRYAYECIGQFASELFDSIRAGKERIRAISQQNTIDVSDVSLHTQQSASADRLNRMATANQSVSSADSQQQQALLGDDQQAAAGRPAGSPNREAARQYLMASRRNSHTVGPADEQQQAAPGGAKSPLQKQASLQQQQQANGCDFVGGAAAGGLETDQDDLEQEIVLDSLASVDGYDYDLEDEFDEGQDDDDDDGDGAVAADGDSPQLGCANQGPTDEGLRSSSWGQNQGLTRRRLKSSHTMAASATGERDEAQDEVFHLAKERRDRLSLRYKREFFVRVVSDPRVYRASISGDINASCNSLGNSQQPAACTPATTTTMAATATTTTTSAQSSANCAGQTSGGR